jgi:beta-lactamase regulating signal transducer with metallopeptidase domain
MDWLIPLAAKSFLIAGGALLLLKLLEKRSAADRSWIAHLALAALLLLPVATVALPHVDVVGPEFLVGKPETPASAIPLPTTLPATAVATSAPTREVESGTTPVDWSFWGYAVPATVLVLLTLIALIRLFVLKARASVLVDAPWLTALARAQKRMGFKHGTALLTSNELPSPISWGVVRPIILLNAEAAESHDEAEAIITHELAHVARLDWAKLLLARVTVALLWFNPLVWLLSREAHQLREEAADDAVLATDIDGTEYASLLVGVARHECRGFLIGAHGVAPARNSLTRRVKRVLDGAVKRAPGGWRWGSAAAFFAAGMAVPVAALNLVQPSPATATDQPLALASGVGSQQTPSFAHDVANPTAVARSGSVLAGATAIADAGGNSITSANGETLLRAADGRTIRVSKPDSSGHRQVTLDGPQGHLVTSIDEAEYHAQFGAPGSRSRNVIDDAIAMKAVGADANYIAQIRAAAPSLHFDNDSIVGMKSVGVTPSFIRTLASLGYRNLDADEITGAYSVGVREDYIRALAAAGYGKLPLDELTQLKAVGVTPADIEQFRRAGYSHLDIDQLVQLKTLGITPEELRASERSGP